MSLRLIRDYTTTDFKRTGSRRERDVSSAREQPPRL